MIGDPNGQAIGRYKIIEKLGQGGMATVYRAHDPILKRDVAIKIIRTGKEQNQVSFKRFELEAKILARLAHPNIISVLDYGSFEGSPYLVMELISGGTLIEKATLFSYTDAAKILLPIAHALAFIHQQKIIHRDIKPSNILITQEGDPMLSDFGIARLVETEETMDLTKTGAGIGTPAYMAPEQVLNKDIDRRADLYSLGMVYYRLVTGTVPFQGDTPYATMMKQISEPLPPAKKYAANLPDFVDQVLFKALEKKPEDRFQSMDEFSAALEQLAAGRPANLGKKKLGQQKIILVGAAAALLVAAGLGFAMFQSLQNGKIVPAITAVSAVSGMDQTITPPPVATAWPSSTPSAEPTETQPAVPPTAAALPTTAKPTAETKASWASFSLSFQDDQNPITSADLANGIFASSPVSISSTNGVSFSPPAGLLLTGIDNGFSVFDLKNARQQDIITGSTVSITTASRSGKLAASFLRDGKVQVWNLESGQMINSFFIGSTASLAFFPDDQVLYSGSLDGMIRAWTIADGKLFRTMSGHQSQVNALAFTNDGKELLSASEDKTVRIWNVEEGIEIRSVTRHSDRITSLAVSGDDRLFASSSVDGVVPIIQHADWIELHTLRLSSEVTGLSFSPDGKMIALVFANGTLQFWDTQEAKLIRSLPSDGQAQDYQHAWFSDNGTAVLCVIKSSSALLLGLP